VPIRTAQKEAAHRAWPLANHSSVARADSTGGCRSAGLQPVLRCPLFPPRSRNDMVTVLDAYEPVHAMVAERDGNSLARALHLPSQHHFHRPRVTPGLVHHRGGSRPGCGRALIESVYEQQTRRIPAGLLANHETNETAMSSTTKWRALRLRRLSSSSVIAGGDREVGCQISDSANINSSKLSNLATPPSRSHAAITLDDDRRRRRSARPLCRRAHASHWSHGLANRPAGICGLPVRRRSDQGTAHTWPEPPRW